MGIYVYCLGTPDHPGPGRTLTGVEGPAVAARVAGLRLGVRAAACPAPALDGVRAHNAVVEAATAAARRCPSGSASGSSPATTWSESWTSRRERWGGPPARVDGAWSTASGSSTPGTRPPAGPHQRHGLPGGAGACAAGRISLTRSGAVLSPPRCRERLGPWSATSASGCGRRDPGRPSPTSSPARYWQVRPEWRIPQRTARAPVPVHRPLAAVRVRE
jgi:hypothetical protein